MPDFARVKVQYRLKNIAAISFIPQYYPFAYEIIVLSAYKLGDKQLEAHEQLEWISFSFQISMRLQEGFGNNLKLIQVATGA